MWDVRIGRPPGSGTAIPGWLVAIGLFNLLRLLAQAISGPDRGGFLLVGFVTAIFVILILASLSWNPRDGQ